MAKAAFHFWSADGTSLPFALVLQQAGHPVTWYAKAPEAQRIGRGLVTRADTPPRGSIVIFDCTGQGALGTQYRKQGHRVVGGNPLDKELELDRPAGAKIMRQAGIKTPPTFPFTTIPDAVKFLDKAADAAWFVKVSGDTVESSTFDAPDADTMIRYLEWIESQGAVEPFELQQTAQGTEVSLSGWFDGTQFVPPYQVTIEEKKFLTGDEGPRTGCESCVVWHGGDVLADRTVNRVEDELAAAGYVGQLDLNSIVNADGEPYGIEWTARLGFDFNQAWVRLYDADLGEQLEAFAHQELDEWEPRRMADRSATLRVSIPPYPVFDTKMLAKTRGLPLDDRILTDRMIDPIDVMDGPDGPEAAGASGIVCTVGAVEDSVDRLRERLLDVARELVIPNRQMRVDPLSRADRDMKALKLLKVV